MSTVQDNYPQENCLNVSHINVNHLCNKVTDLTVFLDQPNTLHILGITESRLNNNISDENLSIPNYSIYRRDASFAGHTGIAVYVHDSINNCVKRRRDLESDHVESVWLEVKSTKSSPIYIGFIYRNPAANFSWYDDFTLMLDRLDHTNIVLLGDFNIDLFKPHFAWECITSSFGLTQCVTTATRITKTSSTLIDHIYTNNLSLVNDTKVPSTGLSDHFPVCCSINVKIKKNKTNCDHSYISYRSFKRFDQIAFLNELSTTPFQTVHEYDDPNQAMSIWYKLYLDILNKHAPLKKKRVKKKKIPQWLTNEIRQAMKYRNDLKADKEFLQYKKQRNYVKKLVQKAKKSFIQKIIKDKSDISSIWRAINVLSNRTKSKDLSTTVTLNQFNEHFLSVANSITKTLKANPDEYIPSKELNDFCASRLETNTSFHIPTLSVNEVKKIIMNLKSKKTIGSDGISTPILKISLPYIADSLTYIYNLCIIKKHIPRLSEIS